MKPVFEAKRIYDERSAEDGFRILVDRLWPRGVSKEKAGIDLWAKEFTPSDELRKWYHVYPSQHSDFAIRYIAELNDRIEGVRQILSSINNSTVTLLSSVKDVEGGHVGVLKQFLENFVATGNGDKETDD